MRKEGFGRKNLTRPWRSLSCWCFARLFWHRLWSGIWSKICAPRSQGEILPRDPSIECSSFYLPAVDSFGNIYQLFTSCWWLWQLLIAVQCFDSSYQQPTACIRKAVKEKPQRISGHSILFRILKPLPPNFQLVLGLRGPLVELSMSPPVLSRNIFSLVHR